jgi:hypothetical protein
MMAMPEMSFLDSFDEFDGGIYQAGRWEPDLAFLNKRSGAVIWPPGYFHETRTLSPPDGECGSAFTLQFAFPQPVKYLRAFLPRLSLSSEIGQCGARSWSGYATFFVPGIQASASEQKMREQQDKILKLVDANGDDTITVEETRKFFASGASPELSDRIRRFREAQRALYASFQADDTVAYHDMDDDGKVTKQELWDSLVQWNVVRVRMREGMKYINRADRAGLEAFEKSLDPFRRNPVKFPMKLRPELKALFKLKPGTKVFPSLKGITSLSDSEFYSDARERIHHLSRSGKAEL